MLQYDGAQLHQDVQGALGVVWLAGMVVEEAYAFRRPLMVFWYFLRAEELGQQCLGGAPGWPVCVAGVCVEEKGQKVV